MKKLTQKDLDNIKDLFNAKMKPEKDRRRLQKHIFATIYSLSFVILIMIAFNF